MDNRNTAHWKRLRHVLLAVFSLFAIATIGFGVYTDFLLNRINRQPEMDETIANETVSADLSATETAQKDAASDVINILLIGQDRRPGQTKNARSDAMILCTLNPASKTLTFTSFMRDMYVPIPGRKSNRINAAYAIGGMDLLQRCIEENFGIEIHGNIAVDFAAFTSAIDLVGGVDVALTEKEAKYLNTNTYKDQPHWTASLKEGLNRLDGNLALAYARIRKLSGNDFGRTQRQRNVLLALASRVSELTLPEMHRLLKGLLEQVTTDMSNAQLIGYAFRLLPVLKDYQTASQQIPANGTYRNVTVNGMQVLVPDLQKNRQILEKIVS